jgi:CBS domain-containing protein
MRKNPKIATAAEVMKSSPVTLAPTTPVAEATKTLLRKSISGAPVVDEGRIVGIFSERDALSAMAAACYESEPSGTVEMHMRRELRAVDAATDVFALAALFEANPIRRVPVVDANGKLLGLVMRGDVLRALAAAIDATPLHKEPPRSAFERAAERLEGPG